MCMLSEIDNIVEVARRASKVKTADGPALLLGSHVIHLRSDNPELHIDAIVKALRLFAPHPIAFDMDR